MTLSSTLAGRALWRVGLSVSVVFFDTASISRLLIRFISLSSR